MNNQAEQAPLMEAFEDYLARSLEALPEGVLKEAMAYSLLGGGKRVRPRLLFAALEGYGMNPRLGFAPAAAIEMIHTYSLIHDDLPAMDDDELRRGKPTCHIAYGEAQAILAGDALLTLAFEKIAQTPVKPSIIVQMVSALAGHAGAAGMVYGQILDLQAEEGKARLESVEEIESYKTGCLLQLPLILAAMMAEKSADIALLEEIGRLAGVQFQIQDDILDATRTAQELGKSNSDARNQKSTILSVCPLEKAQAMVLEIDADLREKLKDLSMDPAILEKQLDALLCRTH